MNRVHIFVAEKRTKEKIRNTQIERKFNTKLFSMQNKERNVETLCGLVAFAMGIFVSRGQVKICKFDISYSLRSNLVFFSKSQFIFPKMKTIFIFFPTNQTSFSKKKII